MAKRRTQNAERRTQNAKMQKRKTQKRKNANRNIKRRQNGGYTTEDKGTYVDYNFTKEEIIDANNESKRLEREYEKTNPGPGSKYFEWDKNKPNLKDVVKSLYPEIVELGEKHISGAIEGLKLGIRTYIGSNMGA